MFNARNAICLSLLIAFSSALSWALHWLAADIGLSSFLVFCVAAFAAMVTAGYAFDYWRGRSQQ